MLGYLFAAPHFGQGYASGKASLRVFRGAPRAGAGRAVYLGQEDHDDAFKRDSTPVVRRPITVMVMRLDSRKSSESSESRTRTTKVTIWDKGGSIHPGTSARHCQNS